MPEGLPETLNTPGVPRLSPSEATCSPVQPLMVDQQQRWQKGERVLVETYVEREPSLRANERGMMDLIANEMLLRQGLGEAAPVSEYQQRFPQLASELGRQLAAPKTVADVIPGTLHLEQQTPASRVRAVSSPSAAVPETVAGYDIKQVLGRGGMGVVYKAWQKGLNRTVALKMILAGAHAGTEDVTRFRIEAEAAARLQHPNITQIYEVGEAQGRPFFAMEYVEGCSLADKLDGVPQPPKTAAEMIELLARAMHHAHERGIVHRDLKPANILLMNPVDGAVGVKGLGQPKITDFGLAKRLDADMRQTHTGAVLGTPSYMSPEQAGGKIGEIGPATDVYALGAILYDMLTGRPPFKSNTLADTLHQVQAMEPVSPMRLEPNVPRDLETICLKCLRKEPARRYTRAVELAEDLHRFLNNEPIEARPTPTWERIVKWSIRRPAAAALIVVSVLSAISLLIGGTWSYARIRDSLKREEAQRLQADASFRDALGAVDQMLLQVGAVDLADVPQMEPVRRKLLAQGLGFMQKFLSERGDDPTVQHEAARAYVYEGDIHDMLGSLDTADKAYGSAISQLTALTADSPGDMSARKDLARAYNNLGVLQKKQNRFQDAEGTLREALALREELVKDFPDDAGYKRDLAVSEYFLGAALAGLSGKQKEAQQAYREALRLQEPLASVSADDQRALARTLSNLGNLLLRSDKQQAERADRDAEKIYQQLAETHPEVPTYRRELARSHHNLAVLLWYQGKFTEAEELFDKALKLVEGLIDHFPEVPEYQKQAANIHSSKAMLLRMKAQFSRAETEISQASSILDKLVAAHPTEPDYRHVQGLLYPSLAVVMEDTGRPAEAEKAFDKALIIQTKLVNDHPEVIDYHGDLAETQYAFAESLFLRKPGTRLVKDVQEACRRVKEAIREHEIAWKANTQNLKFRDELSRDYNLLLAALLTLPRHAEAAAASADLVRTFPDDYDAYMKAAQCLAECVKWALEDKKLNDRQRQEVVQDYGSKAVAYIRDGVQKGFKNLKELKQNDTYKPLRDRHDFQELLQELDRGGAVGVG